MDLNQRFCQQKKEVTSHLKTFCPQRTVEIRRWFRVSLKPHTHNLARQDNSMAEMLIQSMSTTKNLAIVGMFLSSQKSSSYRHGWKVGCKALLERTGCCCFKIRAHFFHVLSKRAFQFCSSEDMRLICWWQVQNNGLLTRPSAVQRG